MTTPLGGRALGRREPKNAPALRFASFWTGVIPRHPVAVDHFDLVREWGLWKNDLFGTCGPVSFFNLLKLVTRYLDGVEADPTWEDIKDLYVLNNPTFDELTGEGDDGVDMQTMLELAKAHQVLGPGRIVAFAKIDLDDIDAVRAAISIFGGTLLGVTLQAAQYGQTDDGLWDYSPSSTWGGHAVLGGLYTSDSRHGRPDISVITWGSRVGTTDDFQAAQLDEAWIVILREHLDHPAFQEGVDLDLLAISYEELTGDVLDVPLPPAPEPPPEPSPQPTPAPDNPVIKFFKRIWAGLVSWVARWMGF